MQIVSLFVIFIFIVVFGTSCAFQPRLSKNQIFEFSSGGAYHLQGFGEWRVKLTGDGTFSVSHNVFGEISDFGSFALTGQENTTLWELIRAVQLHNLKPAQRLGVPDEVMYTFVLTDNAEPHTITIWVNDARKNDKITALVEAIGLLIELCTKTKPILR